MPTLSDIEKQIADLEAQKKQLVEEEKKTALKKAQDAVKELNALGFNYTLSETATPKRRSNVRDQVLQAIKDAPGASSAMIAEKLGWLDKAGKQSVANAVSKLRELGHITSDSGKHTAK